MKRPRLRAAYARPFANRAHADPGLPRLAEAQAGVRASAATPSGGEP